MNHEQGTIVTPRTESWDASWRCLRGRGTTNQRDLLRANTKTDGNDTESARERDGVQPSRLASPDTPETNEMKLTDSKGEGGGRAPESWMAS